LAATSAFAQSTVTLYGNIDQSYNAKTKATTDNNNYVRGANGVQKISGLNGGAAPNNFSSNALGVMGTEDLGNGLKANFKIETGMATTQGDGVGATSAFGGANRESWAGLSGGFGEVRAGYQYTAEKETYDIGTAGSGNLNGALFAVAGVGRQVRHDMINFTTPSYNGFTGNVQWGKSANKTEVSALNAATTTNDAQRKHESFGFKYAQGPLTVGYNHRVGTSVASYNGAAGTAASTLANSGMTFTLGQFAANTQYNQEVKVKADALAANYDMGAYKLFAAYSKHKGTASQSTAGVNVAALGQYINTKTYELGIQAPVGAFTPFFSYGKGSYDVGANNAQAVDGKLKGMQLGTTYALSKRTSLYAVYTSFKDTNNAVPVVAGAVSESNKTTQALLGLRHQF
jgi:predicted porin